MLSLVAGRTWGIVKGVNPIIVRLPAPRATGNFVDNKPVTATYSSQDWIDYLGEIDTDLGPPVSQQQDARAVVLIATYWPRSILTGGVAGFENQMYGLLESIIKKGAIVVTGSGNIKGIAPASIDGWPVNFGKLQSPDGRKISSLIVAGAISGAGAAVAYKSDPAGGVPHVYAPVCLRTSVICLHRALTWNGVSTYTSRMGNLEEIMNTYQVKALLTVGSYVYLHDLR